MFTIPKILRPIFRKRRHLLTHLFHTATACLRDAFRTLLHLPNGRFAAAAAVHTFGDYLVFHPHLHILAAHGLFDAQGRFHCLPDHSLSQLAELFRHRFLHALHTAKLLNGHKVADLLSWKNSGFHVHADTDLVRPTDLKGRQRLAEPERSGDRQPTAARRVSAANQYLLRTPFSLQKTTWNADTKTVIYRSRRSWHTTRNIPPPPDPPFDIDTFEPINPPWPAIREWIPADENDPQAVFPEDILSTHWVPTEIRLDNERTLVLDPS